MLYVFHGDDEFTRSEEVSKLKARLGDPIMASLNITIMDGRKLTLTALIQACDTSPFLSDKRMVIVEEFWSRYEPRDRGKPEGKQPRTSAVDTALVKGLLEYLPRVPETTRLLFTESRSLTAANPAHGVLAPDPQGIIVREFCTPRGNDLDRWIVQRMRLKGSEIIAAAAHELALRVGGELRQLDQEMDKLLAHANYQGPVTLEAVRNLVSSSQSPRIFALVDAMGMRQGGQALRHLHELLESGAAPLYLLSMIERQFRILLQAKELMGQGATVQSTQRALGINQRFVVEKSLRQASRFTEERLASIHQYLAKVEFSIKSGEISEILALDLLVMDICT